jgi:hypothetical protein
MAAIAAAATFAAGAGAATARTGVAASEVAATVETRLVIHHFNAAGNKVVGHGSVLSTYRNAAGATMSTSSRPVKLTVATASGPGPCQILYLELDELDLTLLGLRVFLRSATEGEPIRLTLSADSTHGVLGKLFCDLAGATISTPTTSATAATKKATSNGTLTTLGSNRKTTEKWTAKLAAAQLSKKMHNTTILHAQATVYQPSQAPRQTQGSHSLRSAADDPATDCQVLHLILGPLHLDLLGLIADLNKVALDIFAIPGTTIGDLFCSLTGGAPPATAAPTSP